MTERHPLKPFLPTGAKILMLGSFPPPMKRWKMPFYYPNFQNDMWRIFGIVFFNDINHFIDLNQKCFKQQQIVDFLTDKVGNYYEIWSMFYIEQELQLRSVHSYR